jgi:hypothetical protein
VIPAFKPQLIASSGANSVPWAAVAFFASIAVFELYTAQRLWAGKSVGRLRVERQDSWASLLSTSLPIGLSSAFFVAAMLVIAASPSRGVVSLVFLSAGPAPISRRHPVLLVGLRRSLVPMAQVAGATAIPMIGHLGSGES